MRTEIDSIGALEIPDGADYGIHTARAVENFPITGTSIAIYPELIQALACIKQAAALANYELGLLDQVRAQDPAVVVHRPDRHRSVPDDLLPDEIRSAEIAVAVGPIALRKGQIMRAKPAWFGLRSISNITGALGFDDKRCEIVYVHVRHLSLQQRHRLHMRRP